jgi:hypothetical protein
VSGGGCAGCDRRPRRRKGLGAVDPLVGRRRRDDEIVLHADLVRARTAHAGVGDDAVAVDRRIGDDAFASADARTGHDAIAASNARPRRSVVLRSTVVLVTSSRTTRHVRPDLMVVDVTLWTIHVMVVVVIPAERPAVGDAVVPVPRRRRRSPADVAIARGPRAPGDPRAGVATTRDPCPAVIRHVHPAAVVEWRPAPRVVRHPDVVRRFAVGPVARGDVRLEVRADLFACRDPDRAVRRVAHPRAVAVERRLELGEGARIGVRIFVVTVGADEDLARLGGRLLVRRLLSCELVRGQRRRRRVLVLLRVFGLGLVASASDRQEARRQHGGETERATRDGKRLHQTR